MVTPPSHNSTLVFRQKVPGLQTAIAFGTSMTPFLKPGVEINSEFVSVDKLCVGDVVTFKSYSGTIATHRVIKIFNTNRTIYYLTKGDNRLDCDPPVLEEHILGRVTHVSGVNIRSLKWRLIGRAIAFFSHKQFLLYQSLAQSRLNKIRHSLGINFGLPPATIRFYFPD